MHDLKKSHSCKADVSAPDSGKGVARKDGPATPWAVWFRGNFWGHSGRDRAGQELPLGKTLCWGGTLWHIPAAYLCAAGIVLDLCMEVEPERLKPYIQKWLDYETGEKELTEELREQAEAENPLRPKSHAKLYVNGKELRRKHGCGIGWIPDSCAWEGYRNEPQARQVLEHYGLDMEKAWSIRRVSFPWATRRRPRTLRDIRLTLIGDSVLVAGPHFCGAKTGTEVPLTHPVTGAQHMLTVLECKPRELPERTFQQEDMLYPRHGVSLTYAVVPELAPQELQVRDCAQSDSPRPKEGEAQGKSSCKAVSVGVIYRTNAPAAVCHLGVRPQSTFSALHFEPVEDVEWRITFEVKTLEDAELLLLP